MFRKLISNLPFNPSLLGTVSFYAKRVKQEEGLRRLGFGFMALAMFVQIFAVMAPPEPTLAASSNDIIRGGFANRDQAVLHCLNPERDFNAILNQLGITCENVGNARTETIRSTDHGGNIYSMGRIAKGPAGKSGKPTNEHAVNVNGNTYFMRRLASFDSGAYSSYKALVGTTSTGRTFMILFDCGNPALVGQYEAPPPPPPSKAPEPTPEPTPTPVDNATCEVTSAPGSVKRGEQFTATIRVRNAGTTTWDPNNGYMLGSQSPQDNLNWGKARVFLSGPVGPGSSQDLTSTFTAPQSPGTYNFSWQMLQSGVKWFGASCSKPITVKIPDVPKIIDLCPDIPGNQSDVTECAPCEESTNDNDVASCLIIAKTAKNVTQGIEDANGTTAAASDEITYTLSVKNSGKVAMKNFVFEEVLVDVLEYSDLKEYGDASFNDKSKVLKWDKQNIEPGQTAEKVFTVKVKSEIPQTPASSSDQTSFDLTMTNVFYGTTVNIHLPPGVGKTTEQVVTTLPSTGPGTSLLIGFIATTVIAYFFARSRLLRQELDIIRTDFAQSGGI